MAMSAAFLAWWNARGHRLNSSRDSEQDKAEDVWHAACQACAKIALDAKRTTGPDIDPDDEVDASCAAIAAAICEQA